MKKTNPEKTSNLTSPTKLGKYFKRQMILTSNVLVNVEFLDEPHGHGNLLGKCNSMVPLTMLKVRMVLVI